MNRADWQQIAEEKLLAADALLATSQWASAYYLAGYAIECGLKSCILARLGRFPEIIFDRKNRKYSDNCWCHIIPTLVDLAGLKPDLDAAMAAAPALAANYLITTQWISESRYIMKTQAEAENLCEAITDPVNGVMQWIRARW